MEVMDASGVVIATQTSVSGRFVEIPLPAGAYTVTGTFVDDTINGMPRRTQSRS